MALSTQLWEKYKIYIKCNPQSASQLEAITRLFSYIIPAKFTNSEIVSELLYSASSLLVFLNDSILRGANKTYVRSSKLDTLPRIKSCLAVVECLEVFLEVGAEMVGGTTLHWVVIICIQIFKTVARFLILNACPRGLQTIPAVPALNRKKDINTPTDSTLNITGNMTGQDASDHTETMPHKDEPYKTFTLQRSGRTVRTIQDAPTMMQRTWQAPSTSIPKAPVATELNDKQQLAEGLYLCRPLLHLLSMGLFGTKSWKPWLVASGVDISSLYLMGDRNVYTEEERTELTHRTTMLLFYLLRSPFYDTFTKKHLLRLLQTIGRTIPGARLIINPLMEYLPVWQRTYLYVWGQ